MIMMIFVEFESNFLIENSDAALFDQVSSPGPRAKSRPASERSRLARGGRVKSCPLSRAAHRSIKRLMKHEPGAGSNEASEEPLAPLARMIVLSCQWRVSPRSPLALSAPLLAAVVVRFKWSPASV